jgi:HD-GYP domain-containing protein (c-di-GMP phosphodiesterase class II)
MRWLLRLLPRRALPYGAQRSDEELDLEETQLAMSTALVFGLQARNNRFHFAEHCTRVARLVDRLACEVKIDGAARADLVEAARLHEVGMIAIPPELLDAPRRLLPDELARVRGQARSSAEIVRSTHPPRVAWLIENQYTDYRDLKRDQTATGQELLLAGILRIADTLDAVTHPRPYQPALPYDQRARVLLEGSGSRFHPEAASALLIEGYLSD